MSHGKRYQWLKEQEDQIAPSKSFENIVLFDMDGTLTPPRESFDLDLLRGLRELSTVATIGIVSGSDIDYIYEQMSYVIQKTELVYNLHLLPCNGTKWYRPLEDNLDSYTIEHEVNMRSFLGYGAYQKLISSILELQCHIAGLNIPLTGEFVQYRGSMVNWCPIGRSATSDDRIDFIKIDKRKDLRLDYLKRLKRKLSLYGLGEKITCSLGGDTSFDIYPTGWDKTYALRHFEQNNVWFVGDRCDENGNDKTIYDTLAAYDRSYKTEGPKQTKLIIAEIVNILKSEKT